jgi:methyl-accepting chemotaxis protein
VRHPMLRFTGAILIITALLGIVFSISVLVLLWINKPSLTNTLKGNVVLIQETLTTTSTGLVVIEDSLESSISSFEQLQITVTATANSINDSAPMVDTLVVLTSEDLPAMISSAQLSLEAAQDSAEIIDGLLSFLANLPLVPRNLYNPPVPLHVALRQVSESLDSMPQALNTIEESLSTTSANFEVIQGEISLIAEDLSGITTSLSEGRAVIEEYQVLVADLQTRADRMEQEIDSGFAFLTLVLSFILVWTAISQIGLLLQGIDLLTRKPAL